MAVPTFVDNTIPEAGVGLQRLIKSPATTKIGQLILVSAEVTGVGLTLSMPEDWVKIGQIEGGGNVAAWFWKIATKEGAEEANLSWGGAGLSSAVMTSTFESFDNASPFAAAVLRANNIAAENMVFSSATPGQKETLSILSGLFAGIVGKNAGVPPAGYTERQDFISSKEGSPYLATGEPGEGETGEKTVTILGGFKRTSLTAHLILASEPKAEKEQIEEEELLQRVAKLARPPQATVIAIAEGGKGRGFDLSDEVSGLTFSNVNPGGDEVCSFTISRSWFAENPEIQKGNLLRVGYGIDILWQGRIEEIDRGTGDEETLSVTCYGLGNRLGDTTFREIYIDQDKSKWGSIPNPRIEELGSTWETNAGAVEIRPGTSGLPALALIFNGLKNLKGTRIGIIEAWYNANGIPLGSVYLESTAFGGAYNGNLSWVSSLSFSQSDHGSSGSTPWGLGASTFTAPDALSTYAFLNLYYNETEEANKGEFRWEMRKLATYGRHGLAGKGEAPLGFSADQIVGHMLTKASGIVARRFSTFGYIITQFTVETPTTPRDGIAQANELAGADYGTWGPNSPLDNSTNGYFDYTEKEPAVQHWFATRADFEEDLNFHTETSSLYDTVEITYTDESGASRVERVSTVSPDLREAGLSPRVFPFDAGLTTKAGAKILAEIFLDLIAGFAPARGSGTISKPVRHYRRGMLSPCYLRADGSNIRIPDILPAETTFSLDSTPDRRTTFPIKRVTVDLSGEVPKATVEFDQTNDSLAVLLAQEAAQAALVG